MILTKEIYNSPDGKVDFTPLGSMTNVATGTTATGTVNSGSGVAFGRGTDLDTGEYFGNAARWNDLVAMAGSSPVYVSYTPPVGGLPAGGCMVATYVEFDGLTPETWNGMGEVALYGRFSSDNSDIRLMMYMGTAGGEPPFAQGGWAIPDADRSLAFVIHDRDIFAEVSGLAGLGWDYVKELRLVFRSSVPGRAVRIRDLHIYESITLGPSAECTSAITTQASVDFVIGALGASGTLPGMRAGIAQACVIFDGSASSVTGTRTYAPAVTAATRVSFLHLSPTMRSRFLELYDTYGNKSYVPGSWGRTTRPTGTFVVTPYRDAGTVSAQATVAGDAILLHSYVFYRLEDGEYVATAKHTYSPPITPEPIALEALLEPTGGGAWRIRVNAMRDQVDAFPGGEVETNTYYYVYESTRSITDDQGLSVLLDMATALSTIRPTVVVHDAGGIASISYIQVGSDGSETVLLTRSYSDPRPVDVTDDATFPATPGTYVTIKARATDAQGNPADSAAVTLRAVAGRSYVPRTTSLHPEISAQLLSDGSVTISWTNWDGFLDASQVIRYTPHIFRVWRRLGDVGDFTQISGDLGASTREYIDSTLVSPGIYQYLVQGMDRLGNTKAIAVTVDVTSTPTITVTTFVEDFLQMLPKWTAAVPKLQDPEAPS